MIHITGRLRPALVLLTLALLHSCKSTTSVSESEVKTISGSTFPENDPSLYVLDERNYDGNHIDTLTVRRMDCGGEERLLQGTIEELLSHCHAIRWLTLKDLIVQKILPFVGNGQSETAISEQQRDFLIYLVYSLRTHPLREKTLNINFPEIGIHNIDVSRAAPKYSPDFQKYFARLSGFLPYDLSYVKDVAIFTTSQLLHAETRGDGWLEQLFRVNSSDLPSISEVKLTASKGEFCPVALVSVRLGQDNGQWSTLNIRGGKLDTNGYYQNYLLSHAFRVSSARYIRLTWRILRDEPFGCKVSFTSTPNEPVDNGGVATPPINPGPIGNTNLSRVQKFRQLTTEFSSVGHRLHHFLWHSVRNAWNRPGTSDYERKLMAQLIPGQNWTPPRPVIYGANGSVDIMATEQIFPGAGEDFLHMHREMIKIARSVLGNDLVAIPSLAVLFQQRERMIAEGLVEKIPVRSLQEFQDQLGALMQQEQRLKSIDLRSISLGTLGTRVEWTLHNGLHERFARPAVEMLLIGGNNPWSTSSTTFFDARMPWNQVTYQHLGDPYSSATNPIFWLIHTYVDQWIDRWANAHGFSEVSDRCVPGKSCYQWLNGVSGQPWDGGMGVDHAHTLQVAALPDDIARSLVNMGTFVTR